MSGVADPAVAVVAMPAVSEGMEEGTLLSWLVADGATVAAGEALAEIETDKATTEVEAPADGRVWHVAGAGDTVPVGGLLATLGPERTAPAASVASSAAPAAPGAAAPPGASAASGASAAPAASAPVGRTIASPLARRLAREHGIALDALRGSGPRGRVVRADVLEALVAAPAEPATPASPPAALAPADGSRGRGEVTRVALSGVQTVIARRMADSRATVPAFDVSVEVDMTEATELRRRLRALAPDAPASAPSLNDMVVKACALALREHPRVNGSYVDAGFELYSRVNVGIAVAGDDALLVPTVFDADRRSLRDIAVATRGLAARARAAAVAPEELAGGTFTVSNLGMFGVSRFAAIVNPPQAAILAVGSVAPAATLVDGELAMRSRMTLTLSADHRILYGADAAAFLATVRALLERPLSLLLG